MDLHSIFPTKIQGFLLMLLFSHAHSSKWPLKIRLCTCSKYRARHHDVHRSSVLNPVWILRESTLQFSSKVGYFFIRDLIHFVNSCKVHFDKCSLWSNTLLLLSIVHANLKKRWSFIAQQRNSLGVLVQTKDATTSVFCPEEEMVIMAQPKGMTQLASIINNLQQEKDIHK